MSSQDIDPLDLDSQDKRRDKHGHASMVAQQIRDDDIRQQMSNKWGRRLTWRLLEMSGVNQISFNTNALTMAFNEGNRNVGNQLLAEVLKLCPDRYTEMLKEQKQNGHDDRTNT